MDDMTQGWYEWACGDSNPKDANINALTEAGGELGEYAQTFNLDEDSANKIVAEVLEVTYDHFPEDSKNLGGLTRAQATEKLQKDFKAAAAKLNIELIEK